jgi:RimJ/RimL family protein N-acetyltransferase
MTITTQRLMLRPWCDSDLAPFAEQNADPHTMRFFPSTLTRAESDAYAARHMQLQREQGLGKWAVELPGIAPFIGAVGLQPVSYAACFTPAIEVAWRLHRAYWGQGYATEAARAVMADGFERLGLAEIVAVTALPNLPSQRVMQRLGMTRDREFDHPRLPEGHALRRHILYRLRHEQARSSQDS